MSQSFNTQNTLRCAEKTYHYFDLKALNAIPELNRVNEKLPFSLKVLLENMLRFEDGKTVTCDDILAFGEWLVNQRSTREIAFRPARVLMQDFTGVPAVVDLAAMRDAMARHQGNPDQINPLCPVDLVIDHSVQVDNFGSKNAFDANVILEMQRNKERYSLLKWGQHSFANFQAVPPGTGICHQVNLEYLGQAVWTREENGKTFAFPDTLVGTDSHTTMINGLGVLGWGVGGIEAEAAMLGQPISMLIPEVIGCRLEGELPEGTTATDLVLTVTQKLRAKGVVGKFVEYFGPGLKALPLADRATLANMAPEYGATCGFFPIDAETVKYLRLTGRPNEVIERVEAYAKAQGLWHDAHTPEPLFTDIVSVNLNEIQPSLAGPKRPQDRVNLSDLKTTTHTVIKDIAADQNIDQSFKTSEDFDLNHGDVVLAAITSCTNTSNPSVMLAAGLVAQKAIAKGLKRKPWVKSSLAPGSKVVTEYLQKTNLLSPLEALGFHLVGYGCTTCIGNSGPLPAPVAKTIADNDLVVSGVLSGNRNFEGRIHPQIKANWLASPPLVVAFALAGTTNIDITSEPLGTNDHGEAVYLRDIWPSHSEVAEQMLKVNQNLFVQEYQGVFDGDEKWQAIGVTPSKTYDWQADSTYVRNPPYFDDMTTAVPPLKDIQQAKILAIFGDSVTTDHISPAGAIKADSPAGIYLQAQGVLPADFNSYGSRRGNHEVMMRGTFANIRIRNQMVPGVEGGVTKHFPSQKIQPIFDAAMAYQEAAVPLVVIAGKEYGTGSSRDWAAKGTLLLGVKAVIAKSFERIHRSNLIGMGVLPLQFMADQSAETLALKGEETIDLSAITHLTPGGMVVMTITRADGTTETVHLQCRIDTQNELRYYENGGILHYVLRKMIQQKME